MRKLLIRVMLALVLCCITLPCYAIDTTIKWTDEELGFIGDHPVIKLGIDPAFIPFEFVDANGQYNGIAADYIQLLTKKTGLTFVATPNLTWPEAYDKALSGEIDALPAVSKTVEREQHFLFSQPYYHFKRVIVSRDTNSSIKGLESLHGLTVAVQKNSSHHSYLLSFPKVNLSLYDSVEAALTAVANGTETAFVGNLATTNYLIRSTGLTHLKFIAFEADEQLAIHFAVRKDWPQLVSILNKALATITEQEKIEINHKWIGVDTQVDNGPLMRILLIAGSLLFIVFTVSVFWILRLRKEIAKRKMIQLDLEKAKQEAEDANNVKSSFLARMSHEIRTPLNAITGMAYLLKKTNITLTQKMYISRITQASTNMLSIINDILDFSKIEAGKVNLEIISFNLDQVIQDVVNIVSYKIEEQEIGFKLSKDPILPSWFLGDAKRIEQILLNIINNAAKFTSSGEVSLDIRLVAKEAENYHLAFTIKDTGIGMSQAQVQQLFEPFAQGDISINRRFGGTGLGLSIVKNLVDMMNGQIQVYSTEGEGSTFIIHLSLALDKSKEEEYKRQISVDYFKNMKTLVLEKTGASMNIIDSYLGSFGMHCELTTSPASAVSMLESATGKFSQPFDLFILDYETPPDGGLVFIEALRKNKKIVKLPKIVMLLPMMRDDLFDKLDEYAIDQGIGKPIIPSILFNAIIELFRLKAIAVNQASISEYPDAAVQNPLHILVVEDNKTNQLIAKSLLQQAGFAVTLASDGKAGLQAYSRHSDEIDLILMDLHMPVLSGYDAAAQIRKLSQSIPIVAMTADVILGVKEKCEAHGIHHYISKPFDPERFISIIRTIIKESAHTKQSNPPPSDLLDRALGLRNLGANEQLYEQVLHEYTNENKDTAQKLAIAIEEKRYPDAIQLVHKVKSSSGSIGATTLHQMAARLQKALQENNEAEIERLHHEFSAIFKKLLQALQG